MVLCKEGYELLQDIVDTLSPKDVEPVFVENEEIGELSLKHRNKDKSTDVLSFPLQTIDETLPPGSIVTNRILTQEKAREFHHSLKDEVPPFFIHAMPHLLGLDRKKDRGEMRQKEKELIHPFKLSQSLIVRAEAL